MLNNDELENDEMDLEKLINEEKILTYDPDCVRKKSNWSKASKLYKFDDENFDKETLLNDLPDHSPKLETLIKKIEELDKKDLRKYGKLFKHFIFSDLKSGSYGAKILASSLIAKGMNLGYTAQLKKPAAPSAVSKIEDNDSDSDVESEEQDGGDGVNCGLYAMENIRTFLGNFPFDSTDDLIDKKFSGKFSEDDYTIEDIENRRECLTKMIDRFCF